MGLQLAARHCALLEVGAYPAGRTSRAWCDVLAPLHLHSCNPPPTQKVLTTCGSKNWALYSRPKIQFKKACKQLVNGMLYWFGGAWALAHPQSRACTD